MQATARFDAPLPLDCGQRLPSFELAYETYGRLAPGGDNAILICHGLTTTQHAAGPPDERHPKGGWWNPAIGPGKAIDTDRFFVLCSNVLGGFGGSTGPASRAPGSRRAYGMRFPVLTIADMVRAQVRLADRLGIDRFHAVVGGCMGGFQVLEWLRQAPERIGQAVVISAGPRVSAHTIALWHVLGEAIRSDPHWNGGDYDPEAPPQAGLALASRIGALFWMSRGVMDRRFGLRTVEDRGLAYDFSAQFEIEAFLQRIGTGATHRIDPNSLLYLMRAMSYFDLTRDSPDLGTALGAVRCPVFLASYASDWRYPPHETEPLRAALAARGVAVEHRIFDSAFGHGAFVYDFAGLGEALRERLGHAPARAS